MKRLRNARKVARREAHRGDRKFIDRRDMRMIRWDTCVVNAKLKRDGSSEQEYVSLHAWGCGCCFTLVKQRLPPETEKPKR